ncbi:MAG: sterol desaturase family protein [Deltaproteobacteria bacterium]|nr:MAG: sterol desaturase family protein [Deltaproteobacteria bacterium]
MDPIVLYAIPFFVLTMLGEWRLLRRLRQGAGYTGRDTAASLSMGVGYLVIAGAAALATVPLYMWLSGYAFFDLSGFWWTWPLLIVLEDLCYYWYHRCSHEVRVLWASHVNHHSSRHYNLSTALRQSWTTSLTGWVFWVPLVLLGFPVELILLQKALNLLYQYWIHTESVGRIGPLEWVLNTPSHHRVHHGRNLRYLDRNYGGIFIIWDRLFGTFEPERDEEPVEYGLIHQLDSHNPVVIAFHEWKALFRDIARRPARALEYLFRPPGWQPDGRSETVPELLARQQAMESAPANPPEPVPDPAE